MLNYKQGIELLFIYILAEVSNKYHDACMRVDNIDKLYSYVKKNGWDKISDIKMQHWGGKECDVTTIDGGVMRFFQLD